MDSEKTRVWIRSEIISLAVSSKSNNSNNSIKSRRRQFEKSRSISNSVRGGVSNQQINESSSWGWIHAIILSETNNIISILIIDNDCNVQWREQNIDINVECIKNDDILMDNIYNDNNANDMNSPRSVHSQQKLQQRQQHQQLMEVAPDDLIHLTHLHEPAVVHCLRSRFSSDKIYTATGPILIAINPLKDCSWLYSNDIMRKYWTLGEMRSGRLAISSSLSSCVNEDNKEYDYDEDCVNMQHGLEPHVYTVADDAYRTMMRTLDDIYSGRVVDEDHKNQSILVSGESGAGKTVTTKIVMNYLTTLSQRSADHNNHHNNHKPTSSSSGSSHDIEQQILQSNPILESFGNARTLRNDNSSRFGKYIEIQFNASGCLVGASIDTYLLEKVRLLSQSNGERNYHIFYEILQGITSKSLRKQLLLDFTTQNTSLNASDFKMTASSSHTYARRDGVSDQETYNELCSAMNIMDFEKDEQFEIIQLCCSLLHSSNITFIEIHDDECQLDVNNIHLQAALELLGLSDSIEAMHYALCCCTIEAAGEVVAKTFSVTNAIKALEAFIKALYSALFTYLVRRINNSVFGLKHLKRDAYIGVLDIFGFESFATNSFEQLCINYCNEALQQQFNHFIFKLEQSEYERECIAWSFITFPDNQDILDLIDNKRSGILSILDEQCMLGQRCNDRSFVSAVYDKCQTHDRFTVDKNQRANGLFTLHHYAGPVEYNSSNFLIKNKDEVPLETTKLLNKSNNMFVQYLGTILMETSLPKSPPNLNRSSSNSSSLNRTSVGGQFSAQLHQLRRRIASTTPHYIRCLKPNDILSPNKFDCAVIADQLRCAGILEAIRVSRVGFPQRYTHERFIDRYRILGIGQDSSCQLQQHRRHRHADNSVCIESTCSLLVHSIAEQILHKGYSEDIILNNSTTPTKRSNAQQNKLLKAGIQFGKTKVFFRRWAFDIVEQILGEKKVNAAIKIQSVARRFLVRVAFINWLRELYAEQGYWFDDDDDHVVQQQPISPTSDAENQHRQQQQNNQYIDDGKTRILIHALEELTGDVPTNNARKPRKEFMWVFQNGRWIHKNRL